MLVQMLALGLGGARVTLVDEATGEMKWEVQSPKMALLAVDVPHTNRGGGVVSAASQVQWEDVRGLVSGRTHHRNSQYQQRS